MRSVTYVGVASADGSIAGPDGRFDFFGFDCDLPAWILEEDPELVAQVSERRIEKMGREQAGRRLGIRIKLERVPTCDALASAARTHHLSVLHHEQVGASV